MICNKKKTSCSVFYSPRILIYSISFIFQFFAVSALAETISGSLKEANSVVKKNGRIFLMHQPIITPSVNPSIPSGKENKTSQINNLRDFKSVAGIKNYTGSRISGYMQ